MAANLENRAEDGMTKVAKYIADDPNVSFALIFGSSVSGRQRSPKDIDIAVYFVSPPEPAAILTLINRLSDLAGREADVVVLNNASAFLRHQVMKTGRTLVIKDSLAYRRFREKTISDYDEYKFVSGMHVYDR